MYSELFVREICYHLPFLIFLEDVFDYCILGNPIANFLLN